MTAIIGVILRQKEYWMGWPGAAYPVGKYEKQYAEEANVLVMKLGLL